MSNGPETLTVAESEELLNYLKNQKSFAWSSWRTDRNYLMALLMLDAGLRVGEVCKLRMADLIFAGEPARALNLTVGLAEKSCTRIIPLTGRILEAAKTMLGLVWSARPEMASDYAFFEQDCRKPISVRQVQRIIGAASMTAFGRKIHPHVLRHTFATRLMRVTSTPVVQQLLGHKHLSSTQVYVHPNSDDCTDAITALSNTSKLPSQ